MRVAVYGTLRQGFGNNRLLDGYMPIFEGFVSIPYRMVSLHAFPGLIRLSEGLTHDIYVEVYDVDEAILRRLDSLEGFRAHGSHSNFYDRDTVDIPGVGECFIYSLREEDYGTHPAVPGGDWKSYRRAGA